jgi:hypothetical protein
MKYVSFLLLLLLTISCSTVKMVKDPAKASPKIVLSKGACFGECPVYTLTIYNTGLMKFNGVRFTKMDGKHEKQLSEEAYIALVKNFDDVDLWKYDDVYDMQIADLPTTSISYSSKEKTKSVKGKADRPEKILELENALISLIDLEGWVMTEAPADQLRAEEKRIIDDEIIIKGNDQLILVRWLKTYEKYDMKIGKRLGPNSEYWVVKFDKTLIDPAEMLKMIQDDPAINEAEFNKVLKNRK